MFWFFLPVNVRLSRYHGFRLAVLTRVHTSVAVRWPRASPRSAWPSRGARSLALPDRAGGLAGRRLCLLGTVRPAHRPGPPVRPGAGLLASTGKNRKNGSGLGLGLWSGVAQTARGVGVLAAAESSDRRRVVAAAARVAGELRTALTFSGGLDKRGTDLYTCKSPGIRVSGPSRAAGSSSARMCRVARRGLGPVRGSLSQESRGRTGTREDPARGGASGPARHRHTGAAPGSERSHA